MAELDVDLEGQLARLAQEGLLRTLVPLVPEGGCRVTVAGKHYINLSGNDYLGIGSDRELVDLFYRDLHRDNVLSAYGLTSSASRLMTGNSQLYELLEGRLAELYGTERALVFNSGYHTNVGMLSSLAGKGDLILADKLCHASIIDGMHLSRADTLRYRHLDYEHLEELLRTRRDHFNRVLLVSESIFSMDGDRANLKNLIDLKHRYRCSLYLDEAHGVGVFGARGLGLAEQEGVIGDIDLLIGTFGKALAGLGGYVVCSDAVADYLVNRARSLIYSTALPPVCLHWLLHVLERLPGMTGERACLQKLASGLRQAMQAAGLVTRGDSQIVPVILGSNQAATRVATDLRQAGYWVTAVRPPTVPAGSARLRLSLSAAMQPKALAALPGRIAASLGNT